MPLEPNPEFSQALLRWYLSAQRDLPWRRRQDDPYAVWISEIMLQQTTVSAVIGFYERWMQRFPTIEALADAPVDEVLRNWAGLGYYSRARNIKKAAEAIAGEHGGRLPQSVADLVNLPGIGRYTAGAISSIAYNRNAPILDANVTRVLCRLDGIQAVLTSARAVQSRLWHLAEEIIPTGRARDFNQALMELGALICTPRSPACHVCPVEAWCEARRSGNPEAYPSLPQAKRWRTARHAAVAISRGEEILIVRRRDDDTVWAGFWEMPRMIAGEAETLEECAQRAARETVGLEVELSPAFGRVNHVVTNTKIALTGFPALAANPGAARTESVSDFAWVRADQLHGYAIASPHRKLIALWQAATEQPALAI